MYQQGHGLLLECSKCYNDDILTKYPPNEYIINIFVEISWLAMMFQKLMHLARGGITMGRVRYGMVWQKNHIILFLEF